MSLIQCPSCGAQNAEQARFCGRCGKSLEPQPAADLSAEIKRPRCHASVRLAARFCPSCGFDLAQPSAAGQAIPSPEPTRPPKESHQTVQLDDLQEQDMLVVRWMGGDTQRYPLDKARICHWSRPR